jgi:tight adherence protein C
MTIESILAGVTWLSSPLAFAVLVGLATAMVWTALAPTPTKRAVSSRLGGYVGPGDPIEETQMSKPFGARVLMPALQGVLRLLGRLAPRRNVEATTQKLIEAGLSAKLTALDFYGLRLLLTILLGGGYFLLVGTSQRLGLAAQNTLIAALVGYVAPTYWLRARVRRRKHQILRALPDALDMLSIGVEAGLAFESALLRVGQRWDNALTREFTQAVREMRMGTTRDAALQRVVERCGVAELSSFVAVLVQSSQLGVSISQVLHTQAAQMRVRRRQRAEELARQAGLKMVFVLLLFVFPSMMIVILGPSIPAFEILFREMAGFGGGGLTP